MIFKTMEYVVSGIKKKTAAKGFKEIEVGDKLVCSIELVTTTKRKGLYALSVKVECAEKSLSWFNSQNQFLNNIKNFELE